MNNTKNAKKAEVDTTKKQNVSRYASRLNATSKGGRLNDKTIITVNHDVADKVIDTMPTQVQLLIMNIDSITEQLDKCSMLSLNNAWTEDVMPAYDYTQDSFIVLRHYLTKFNSLGKVNEKGVKNPDTYKGFDKETLLSLFSFNAS